MVSFVALGADDDRGSHCRWPSWDDEDLDNEQPDDETTESDDSELDPVNASLDLGSKPKRPITSGVVSKMRIEAAAESKRIAGIRKVCASKHTEIEARAIEEGWSVTKTELAVLRIERPKAPDQQASQPMYRREVLEAACCLSVGLDETKLLKAYGERTLNAADRCGTLACENLLPSVRGSKASTFRESLVMEPQRFAPASRRCRFLASSKMS